MSACSVTVEVQQAGGAADGMRQIDAHPDLDAVFLDLNMPDVDGFAALDQIGKNRASWMSRKFRLRQRLNGRVCLTDVLFR